MNTTKEEPAEKAGSEGSEEEQKPEMELQVSTDNMTAYLRVLPAPNGNRSVTYEEIMDFLKQHGIVFGIREDAIHDFCDNKKFYLELTCAQGVEPVDETDGKLEYQVKTEPTATPKMKEDGTVDFRDLGLVQNVSKGDVLCRLIPPAGGKDGIDIYNNPARFHKGRMPKFPGGRNTAVSDDGLTLKAAMDGCVEYKNASLNINDVFIVHGDVSSESGNIEFNGTVTVQGDVLEGFTVRAGRDLMIRGMVEGASLVAGENVVISNGMHGMGKGSIRAGGNITGKFFENVKLESGADVYADAILNSQVNAKGSVILKGKNALLSGGKCCAGKRISAGVIGSSNNTRTDVTVESAELTKLLLDTSGNQVESLKAKAASFKEISKNLEAHIKSVSKAVIKSDDSTDGKPKLSEIIREKSRTDIQIQELEKKIKEAEKQSSSCVDYCIIGIKAVYAGTKLKIGDFTQLLASDYHNMKFYSDREHIVSGPVLPSDR